MKGENLRFCEAKKLEMEVGDNANMMDNQGKDYHIFDQVASESDDEMLQERGEDGSMNEDYENSKDGWNEEDILRMVFNSEDDAYQFYNEYARTIGFSVRKHSVSIRKVDHKVIRRIFCCSCEGEHSQKGTLKMAREVRRSGCEAMLEIRLDKDEKYHVVKFVEGHNHDLEPASRVHLLRSHRNKQPSQDGLIINMRSIGINSDDELFQETAGCGPQGLDSKNSKDSRGDVQVLDMTYKSLDEAYRFYNAYAKATGFSVRKHWVYMRKGMVTRRVFCCSCEGEHNRKITSKNQRPIKRTGCEAMIEVKLEMDRKFHVVKFIEGHNHELVPASAVHLLRSHRDRQPSQTASMPNRGTGHPQLFPFMHPKSGELTVLNVRPMNSNGYLQRSHGEFLKKEDVRYLLDHFRHKKQEKESFFYFTKMEEENEFSSCFWCDAKSRTDYRYFGDVVCFDTTYKTSAYDMVFIAICGINNHCEPILLGCGLLEDETTETFVWLFRSFLEGMGGKHPKTIFTQEAVSITKAISQAFPDTHHRLCLWTIFSYAARHLSHLPLFALDFKRCMYDTETEEEFELHWASLLKNHGLSQNDWLRNQYQLREKWAPAYGREYFCAGMTTAQRSESVDNYLKKYFMNCSTLRDFVRQYDKAMLDRHDEEINEGIEKSQMEPDLLSSWKVERQASNRYTTEIFYEFQKEYKKTIDLNLVFEGDDGTILTYKVASYSGGATQTVEYAFSEEIVKCSCKNFELNGILCAHALKLLRSLNLSGLPTNYYLRRWSKDPTTISLADDRGQTDVGLDSSVSARYSELSHIALSIAAKGAKNKELCSMTKSGLMQLFDKLNSFSIPNMDECKNHHDLSSVSHDDPCEQSSSDHLGTKIMLQDPRSRKAKDQSKDRFENLLDRRTKRRKLIHKIQML